jgi:Glycosyl transferase family 2
VETLSVLAHRRPVYFGETLAALTKCAGMVDWRVVLVLDCPDDKTRAIAKAASKVRGWEIAEFDLRNEADPPYSRISRATLLALSLGFATADYVAHLEEDCVPAPDFLRWHAEQAERFRYDPRVFTVNAWSGPVGHKHNEDHVAPAYSPWGWGTWRDRFEEMRAGWDFDFWDRHLNEVLRGDRLGVFSAVSLVRNIGRIGTQPEAEWLDRERRQS